MKTIRTLGLCVFGFAFFALAYSCTDHQATTFEGTGTTSRLESVQMFKTFYDSSATNFLIGSTIHPDNMGVGDSIEVWNTKFWGNANTHTSITLFGLTDDAVQNTVAGTINCTQYPNKPILFIMKEDGPGNWKIYAINIEGSRVFPE